MLSDNDKRVLLEPLFYSIFITQMMLTLRATIENVTADVIKVTVGSAVFSELGKMCLCLNKETRKRVLDCMHKFNSVLFVGFVQSWTRNFIKNWIYDNSVNHFEFHVGYEPYRKYKSVFKIKACDLHMPTDDDPNHSLVKITSSEILHGVAPGNVSTQNFEYSQTPQMVDFCFDTIFKEDLNLHLTRMIQKTHRYFVSKAQEQEHEADNQKRRKLGDFAT